MSLWSYKAAVFNKVSASAYFLVANNKSAFLIMSREEEGN